MKRPRPAIRSYSGLLLVGAVIFQVSFLPAQAIPIAVMDFDGFGISQMEAIALSNRLRNELFRLGTFDVVDRGMMENILTEQDFQMVGCTSNECLVEVGQLLGAKQMMGGSISKVGNTFSVSARLVDVETGRLLAVSDYDLKAEIDDMLTTGMRIVALMLSGDEAGAQALNAQQTLAAVPQGAPPKARSQPTLVRRIISRSFLIARSPLTLIQRIISKLPTGSGHTKTIGAVDIYGGADGTLSIDFGQPSAQKKNIQYGMMIGISMPYYREYGSFSTSVSPLIKDKWDNNTSYYTDQGNYATINDVDYIRATGELFYGMAMVSRSFGWDQGFYGFKLFAAGGLCLGRGTIRYFGEGNYWDEYEQYYYYDSFYEYDNYDLDGLIYTLGGQLRLGYPRFSVILGAKLTSEPIVGLRPFLSLGILWPL